MSEVKPVVRLVDDDASFLFSTQIFLETMGWTVLSYDSPEKFFRHDNLAVPGCVILDYRMPGMTGLEVQNALIEHGYEHFPIIFLSGHGDIQMAVKAMSKGAVTFLEKPADPLRLHEEVQRAVRLGLARSDAFIKKTELKRKFNRLTGREKEVLDLVAAGLSNKDIAETLNLSLATVKMHRGHAAEKLELTSTADITRAVILMQEETQAHV